MSNLEKINQSQMTSYLAILSSGESVDAVRIGTHFESLTGEVLNPVSLVNFDFITRDQYEFEKELKKYSMRGDFSKCENLMYMNSLIDGMYKIWRLRGGLPIDDPEYKKIEREEIRLPESPIYRGRVGET